MNDRELLEMAARAIGCRAIWYGANLEIAPIKSRPDASGTRWNPLADDGDALRLAVKLGILISYSIDGTTAYATRWDIGNLCEWTTGPHVEPDTGAPGMPEAVRLVIVRAAAEIGKAML